MRIALIGTGRMGAVVTRLAEGRGHALSTRFSSAHTVLDAGAAAALAEADIVIDFSVPDAVTTNVHAAVRAGVPIVVGTTGWYAELERVRAMVEDASGAMLYAPNFSLGIAILSQALRSVAPLLNRLDEFDVYLSETHHVRKIDSPSGTALHLGGILLDGLDRKTRLRTEPPNGVVDPTELHVSATRAGSVFGIHEIDVDGPDDHLTFAHQAKSRDGFARGAIVAAEWLIDRTGFYTLDDLVRDWASTDEQTPHNISQNNVHTSHV